MKTFVSLSLLSLVLLLGSTCGGDDNKKTEPEVFEGETGTILFATQVPIGGLSTVMSTFANHLGSFESAPRGGDLLIRYPDGELRNLTREAGFGESAEQQGANGIAVREPVVHWDGNRALFSMAIGAPAEQYERPSSRWQIYEVTGLAKGEPVAITKVPGQPADFNNVSAAYGSDDAVLFVSDRPRNGEMHHYPLLDEYESEPSTVGIYRLDPGSQEARLIEHSPSGVFSVTVDSVGRVIFTKWDHLQRDQQGDTAGVASTFEPYTFADESADAATTTSIEGQESFPEPRSEGDPAFDDAIEPHRYNQFFVWEINQDGTEEETLNHVGRQEWGGSFSEGSVRDDPALTFRAPDLHRGSSIDLPDDGGAFQVRQDPTDTGWYLATIAQEFATGSSGVLVQMEGDPAVNPEDMRVLPLTPWTEEASIPRDTGYFRNPLRQTDGTYLAVHTDADGVLENNGSRTAPDWNYNFRIKVLVADGDRYAAGGALTPGIERSVSWWSPDELASWSGVLWELDPVEVAPRPRPPFRTKSLPDIEKTVFATAGVDPDELRSWLLERDLALLVSRDVTSRDRNDVQQPYRLTVPGGVSSAGDNEGYDVEHIQFFQADYVRSYENLRSGRRVLSRPIHGPDLLSNEGGPEGSAAIGLDGSMAAFVPARRALAWQLVSPQHDPVVRERNWVSFAPGEIRVCAACHGINKADHLGNPAPENAPAALGDLLVRWKDLK
jgi:hypothetical protein